MAGKITSWLDIINLEKQQDYYGKLKTIIDKEYNNHQIYPAKNQIFNAFKLCKYENLKVVILGQDPYHGKNQAQGLAFSTPKNIKNPPSMQNILKEIVANIGNSNYKDGDLSRLAQQGVLLLNTVLTVRATQPNSHKNLGWETFTDNIIKFISENKNNIVFMLWGANARNKKQLIDNKKHLILESAHPSPFSAHKGFFGNKHFSKTNEFLIKNNKQVITW